MQTQGYETAEYERILELTRREIREKETKLLEIEDEIRITKKERVIQMAHALERDGYQCDHISDRISDDLAGYVSDDYIRDVLPSKYKKQQMNRYKNKIDPSLETLPSRDAILANPNYYLKVIQNCAPDMDPTVLKKTLETLTSTTKTVIDAHMDRNMALSPDVADSKMGQQALRKSEQIQTPSYLITDQQREYQDIVLDGINYFIEVLQDYKRVVKEIPIPSEHVAKEWGESFMHHAHIFEPWVDDKYRLDFIDWCNLIKDSYEFGPSKATKMRNNSEIVDLNDIDPKTLPVEFDEVFRRLKATHLSKEHFDSKALAIVNFFLESANYMPLILTMHQNFRFLSKLRNIRAAFVSCKLSDLAIRRKESIGA